MNSLFIDTSGWASLFISTQPYYHQAEQHFRLSLKQQKKLYTTNYILAELVALLNSPLRVSRSRLIEIIAVNRSMTGL
jgi:predicted nucleic acid-binding protein